MSDEDEPYGDMLRSYARVLQQMAVEQGEANAERRRALALAAAMMETLATDEDIVPARLH